jgi:hypothetical protein
MQTGNEHTTRVVMSECGQGSCKSQFSRRRFTHSMPRPCRVAKGLECVFPIRFTQCGRTIHTFHAMPIPCSDHAVLLKATAQHGRRETACGLPARVRLLPATTRSSTKIVISSIPIPLKTIHTKIGSSTLQKRPSVKLLD